MMRNIFFSFVKNTQGSLMVEAAITLPVLVLLLFGAMDVTRFIHAVHKSDIAVDAIANALRDDTEITNEDAVRLLLTAENNMSFKEYFPALELIIEGIRIRPNGTVEKVWVVSETLPETSCNTTNFGAMPANSNPNGYIPHQDLLRVKLCAVFSDDFFLSSIIPATVRQISASTLRHANYLFHTPSGQF